MLKRIQHYFTGDEELNVLLFKVLGVGGVVISFATAFYCLLVGGIISGAMDIAAGFLAILLLHFVEKTGHYVVGYVIVDVAVFMLLFSLLYFTDGGLHGALPFFFSWALMFSFLMFEGKLLVLMESLLAAFYMGVYIVSIRFPQLVTGIAENSAAQAREQIFGSYMTALTMGMIFLLYIWEYRKQKRIAEEASRAKSIFLANMSHEIRTPINAVLGFNDIILRTTKDEAAREYAGYIDESGHRLLKVINEVLDFSRIESGKSDLNPEAFSLRKLAEEMKSLMSIMAKNKSLNIVVDYDEALCDAVVGDREKLVRILTNLLSNAVKYTNEGSVTLHIRLHEVNVQGQKIRFAVEDTGIGIKRTEIDNLFKAYERADLMKNRKIEGTGLGLAITEQLLHLFGGSVHVESTYGEGSTFSFEITLPTAEAVEAAEEAEEELLSFAAPEAAVLVVDDDDMNRRMMDSYLRTLQISADFAESGAECLSMVKERDYHVILMDYMMPEMDGAETMERIRADEAKTGKHTPIVVLTADVVDHIDQKLKERGFDDYLSKPVDFAVLEQILLHRVPEELILRENAEKKPSVLQEQYEACEELLNRYDILFDEGMKLVNGDYRQYLRIAAFFTRTAEADMEKARAAAEEEDLIQLRHTFHALKGKAGSIGAKNLKTAAGELEIRCRNEDTEYVQCGLELVFLQWRRCAEGLNRLLEAEGGRTEETAPPVDGSFEDLTEELRRNLGLCEGKKARALAEQMKKTPEGSTCLPVLDEIEGLIEEMEFDEALEKVKRTFSGAQENDA